MRRFLKRHASLWQSKNELQPVTLKAISHPRFSSGLTQGSSEGSLCPHMSAGWFSTFVEPRPNNGREWYLDMLRDPLWLAKSHKIKERDDWTCRRDGEQTLPLQVHHLGYLPRRKPWEYPDDHLVTLCCGCHKCVHEFSEVPENLKWFFASQKALAVQCAACGEALEVSGVSGRNGKHEPLCEKCVTGMEEALWS